ncbi:MAG: hypothetical protein ACRBEQ_07350 [Hyphomonas sp.]
MSNFLDGFWGAILTHIGETVAALVAAIATIGWALMKSARREFFATQKAKKIGREQNSDLSNDTFCILVAEFEADTDNLLRDVILAELQVTLRDQLGTDVQVKVAQVGSRLKWIRGEKSQRRARKSLARGHELLSLARADVIIFGRATSAGAGFAAFLMRPELSKPEKNEIQFIDWSNSDRRDQAAHWIVAILSDLITHIVSANSTPVSDMSLRQVAAYSNRLYMVVSSSNEWTWFGQDKVKSLIGRSIELLAEQAERTLSRDLFRRLSKLSEEAKNIAGLTDEERFTLECYRVQARLGLFFTDTDNSEKHRQERHALGSKLVEMASELPRAESMEEALYWQCKAKPGLRTYEQMLEVLSRSVARENYQLAALSLAEASAALLSLRNNLTEFDPNRVELMERFVSGGSAEQWMRDGEIDLNATLEDPAMKAILNLSLIDSEDRTEQLKYEYERCLSDVKARLEDLLPHLSNRGEILLIQLRGFQIESVLNSHDSSKLTMFKEALQAIDNGLEDYPALTIDVMVTLAFATEGYHELDVARAYLIELLESIKKFEKMGVELSTILRSQVVYLAASLENYMADNSKINREKSVRYQRAIGGYEHYKELSSEIPHDVHFAFGRINLKISECLLRVSQYSEMPERKQKVEAAWEIISAVMEEHHFGLNGDAVNVQQVAKNINLKERMETIMLCVIQFAFAIKTMRSIEYSEVFDNDKLADRWFQQFQQMSEISLQLARGMKHQKALTVIDDALRDANKKPAAPEGILL